MKKFMVCLTLVCLASLSLAQAGEGKSSKATKAVSTGKAKLTSSAGPACSEKGCGSLEVTSNSQKSCAEKSSCCEKEKIARKVVKPDEKGATFLVRR